jgi:hypothetical protein
MISQKFKLHSIDSEKSSSEGFDFFRYFMQGGPAINYIFFAATPQAFKLSCNFHLKELRDSIVVTMN